MNQEEVLIIWLVVAVIIALLFVVATLFCGIALYHRFDNNFPKS